MDLFDLSQSSRVKDSVVGHLMSQLDKDLVGENATRQSVGQLLDDLLTARDRTRFPGGFRPWPSGQLALLATQLYQEGDGVPASPLRAKAWMRVAVNLREPRALYLRALEALEAGTEGYGRLVGEAIWANCPEDPERVGLTSFERLEELFHALGERDLNAARLYLQQFIDWVGADSELGERAWNWLAGVEETGVKGEVASIQVVKGYTPAEKREDKEQLKPYIELHQEETPLQQTPPALAVREILNQEFPWFAEVTDWLVTELMARTLGQGTFHLPPVLLVGPPGIGKTAYVGRLAGYCDVPTRTLALAGQADNRDLKGTARGWGTSQVAMPVRLIMERQKANPIVVLDELDKVGSGDHNGNIHDFLLQLTEPESAREIYDDFLQGPTDLSWISWVGTANRTDRIPDPLLSRFQVFDVEGPQEHQYPAIVARMRRKFAEEFGLTEGQLPGFNAEDWRVLERSFTDPRAVGTAVRERLKHRMLRDLGAGEAVQRKDEGPAP